MRQRACDAIQVFSAGTRPGTSLNQDSVNAVAEVGASMAGEHPKPIDEHILSQVDRVVILGSDAQVAPVAGMKGLIQRPGRRTSRQNAESAAWSACVWSVMISPIGSTPS